MEQRRPKALVFVPWYLPGSMGGGVVRSVFAAVQALGRDVEFSVVTSDTDLGGDEPYAGVLRDAWNTLPDGTRVLYCSAARQTVRAFTQLIREESPDLVYINGVFSYPFSLLPLRAVRRIRPRPSVLLAARGMLDPAALRQKALKKQIFLRALRASRLHSGITWHASSPSEADAIHSAFGGSARVEVAMDLARPQSMGFIPREKRSGVLRLFFLSRIVPNKNLLGAIRMVKQVSAACRVHLDVYGPVENRSYWARCRAEMHTNPDHVTIEYHGPIEHSDIAWRVKSAHFLLLPTHFENFGHVIVESFALCCPVIISDQTPWRNLRPRGLGWDLPLARPEAFVQAIEEAASMDQETFRAWSERVHQFARTVVSDEAILRAHRDMFLSLIRVSQVG